jgi:hypothetical protein
MNSIELERKMKSKYEAFENDRIFENFRQDEKDLILANCVRRLQVEIRKE